MVESTIDVSQDVKAMLEHEVDINVSLGLAVEPSTKLDRETSLVLEPCRVHVEDESQACA